MAMQKIPVADATADELRRFGSTVLGLPLHGRENKTQMMARFSEANYNTDFILLEEGAPEAGPQSGSSLSTGRKTRTNERGQTEVQIMLHTSDKPGGNRPVPVGVNGSVMLIPRGQAIWVPESYIEVLNNAEEYLYDEYDASVNGGLGGLGERRVVKAYPFSYV